MAENWMHLGRELPRERYLGVNEALHLYLPTFRFSKGDIGLQGDINIWIQNQFPDMRLAARTYEQLLPIAKRAAWAIVKNPSKHRVKLSRRAVYSEAEKQLKQMQDILNRGRTFAPGEIESLKQAIVLGMIAREHLILCKTEDRWNKDRKFQALMKKVPGWRKKSKMENLRQSPDIRRKHIDSPESDPWGSDVCFYIMLQAPPQLYRVREQIPTIFEQLFRELYATLCVMLNRQPRNNELWEDLQTIVDVYNRSPHPRQQIDLHAWASNCRANIR